VRELQRRRPGVGAAAAQGLRRARAGDDDRIELALRRGVEPEQARRQIERRAAFSARSPLRGMKNMTERPEQRQASRWPAAECDSGEATRLTLVLAGIRAGESTPPTFSKA
jgi:hypothetical protein